MPERQDRIQKAVYDQIRRNARWNRWAIPAGYLGGGLLCWLLFSLFGWPGLLGTIALGVAHQIWWRRKHGRWMIDENDWLR